MAAQASVAAQPASLALLANDVLEALFALLPHGSK